MKILLGSIFLFNIVFANDYFFEVFIDKKSAYQNEPIFLNLIFYKKRDLEYIESSFTPPNSENFIFKEFEKKFSTNDKYSITEYKYIIKPLKSGVFNLSLQPTIKKIDKISLIESTIGKNQMSLDSIESGENIEISLKPLPLEIKKNSLKFVGNININFYLEKTSAYQNEPINATLKIEFQGDINELNIQDFNIDGVKIFTESIQKYMKYSKAKGFYGLIEREFVFISNKNFQIPPIEIPYNEDSIYKVAKTAKIDIDIKSNKDIVNLLTQKDDELKLDISQYLKYIFIIIIIFISGFIAGRFSKNIEKSNKKVSKDNFIIDLKDSKSIDALIKVLFKYSKNEKYRDIIEEIDNKIYNKKSINLNSIKSKIIKNSS